MANTNTDGVSPCGTWLSVAAAATDAGCTEGWLRLLLGKNTAEWSRDGRCWKVGARAWALHRDLVKEIKGGLSARSLGNRTPPKRRRKRSG
jgi:hypothetical protein